MHSLARENVEDPLKACGAVWCLCRPSQGQHLAALAGQTVRKDGHLLAQRGGRGGLPVRARQHRHARMLLRQRRHRLDHLRRARCLVRRTHRHVCMLLCQRRHRPDHLHAQVA